MVRELRMTTPVLRVISALLTDPTAERYGLDLMRDAGLASGTLYPILVRLERAGWVSSHWEETGPVIEGRPARRRYRMTPLGVTDARREVALLRQRHNRVTGAIIGGAQQT